MIVLFKKDGMLYAKVLMDLRLPIPYKNRVFGKGKQELLLLPEEVEAILMRNGNMQIWNGKKYIKLGLGQFHELVARNKYTIEEVVIKPKEVPKPKVVEEPKPVEVPVVEEVVKEEPKKEEPQQPKKEEYKQNENKKQRHNNNKQQNQGGDK